MLLIVLLESSNNCYYRRLKSMNTAVFRSELGVSWEMVMFSDFVPAEILNRTET